MSYRNINMIDTVLNAELVFHIIQYINVLDMKQCSVLNKRWYYLIHQYQYYMIGPQFISVSSLLSSNQNNSSIVEPDQCTDKELYQRAVHKLQAPPILSLSYTTTSHISSTSSSSTSIHNSEANEQQEETFYMSRDVTNPIEVLLPTVLLRQNPISTISLGAIAESIQTTGMTQSESNNATATTTATKLEGSSVLSSSKTVDPTYESQSHTALMMLTDCHRCIQQVDDIDTTIITNISIQPFILPHSQYSTQQAIIQYVQENFCGANANYKLMILYVVQNGYEIANTFMRKIQLQHPNIVIVGGMCHGAYITVPIIPSLHSTSLDEFIQQDHSISYLWSVLNSLVGDPTGTFSMLTTEQAVTKIELATCIHTMAQHKRYMMQSLGVCCRDLNMINYVEGGICGVVLSGNVPVRSVVSRGVESVSGNHSFYVHDAELVYPDRPDYILNEPYYLIKKIRDADSGAVYNIYDVFRMFGKPDFIGLRQDHDGCRYSLESIQSISYQIDMYLIMATCGLHFGQNQQSAANSTQNEGMDNTHAPIIGYNIDFFNLSSEQCINDMNYCMDQLQRHTSQSNETILGALMFCCNGRGPKTGRWIRADMGDAKRFATTFPTVPCVGFYAMVEIGPIAITGQRTNIFQHHYACVQEFTVVFAIFIVPTIPVKSIIQTLDDSEEHIRKFISHRFNSTIPMRV